MTKQTSTGPQIETQPSEAIPQDTEVVVDDDRNSSSPSPEPETPRAQV
jgi:hypothetical protein